MKIKLNYNFISFALKIKQTFANVKWNEMTAGARA